MSLKTRYIAVALLMTGLPVPGAAQVFTANGMASGTGLSYLPTPGLTPVAHWRAHYGRIDFLRSGMRGMNVFGMSYGLSTNVEGYARLTGEQLGTLSSLTSYGFGVKGTLPVPLPVVEAAGLWFETSVTEEHQQSAFFPVNTSKGGITLSFGSNFFRGILLTGINSVEGTVLFLSGAGVIWAPGSSVQVGAEILRGYITHSSVHAAMDISVRIVPHVALFASPGYLSTQYSRTWSMSVGFSVATADIDFRPSVAVTQRDEFKLPSLEDIMNEPSEEENQ